MRLAEQSTTAESDLEGPPNVHHFTSRALSEYPVYPLIHSLRKDVEHNIGKFFVSACVGGGGGTYMIIRH